MHERETHAHADHATARAFGHRRLIQFDVDLISHAASGSLS